MAQNKPKESSTEQSSIPTKSKKTTISEKTKQYRVFRMPVEIEEELALDLSEFLSRVEPSDIIVIEFNCLGGDLISSEAAYYLLKNTPNLKIGINMGKVFSGACLPYLACDVRHTLPSAFFLFHDATSGIGGDYSPTNLKLITDNILEQAQDYRNILYDLLKDQSMVDKMLAAESYVNASRAIQLGIAHEYYKGLFR